MKKLIAFGDSYTYGHGLIDCWVKNSNNAYIADNLCSQYAWPALVAKELGCEVVNRSSPGFSNLAILHRLLNTSFDQNSMCVIMWSFPFRDMIFDKKYLPHMQIMNKTIDHTNRTAIVGSWMRDELTKNWILTHNSTDLVMRTWLHIHHANLYLDSINMPHYNFFVDYNCIKAHKPSFISIPFKDILAQRFIDKALDGYHPGPLSQERMAKEIAQIIKDL